MSETRVSRAPFGAIADFGSAPLLLAGLILLAVLLYWPSITALADLWSHPERRTYQHGYLISAVVLWLLFRARVRIAAAAGAPSPLMLVAAALASLAWAIAWQAGLQAIHFLLWPVALWAAATGALGLASGRVLLWPFAYFYFALPVWDALTPVLQSGTVYANQALATLVGMPVMIDGKLIHIPAGSFEIAGGCSGLNYLVVGLAISALLGELNRDSVRRRLFLIALGGGLALISNWLRVFIIIYAGHLSDMTHYLVRVDHYKWGWALFAFVLVLYLFYVNRLPPSTNELPAAPPQQDSLWRLKFAAVAAACAAIALGPLLTGWPGLSRAHIGQAGAVGVQGIELQGVLQWRAGPAIGGWVPVFPAADAESLVEFSRAQDRVTVYTATYLKQSQGRELVGHNSRIQGQGRGRLVSNGRQVVASSPAAEMMEAEWHAEYGGHALLWWTYRVGSRQFVTGLPAQLWYGISSLWSNPVSAIVALHAECMPDCDRARHALQEFSGEAMPQLLDAAGNSGD